jgi:recombination protein RecA
MFPDLSCVFVDVEHGFDPKWAAALGVDVKKLMVVKPSFAEQAVDIVESLMYANNCGLVVIDSLAALVTSSELDSSAEKANVGGAALVIGKLTRKTTQALSEAEKEDRYPTLIYINQISYKIGVMFGDPETEPGGKKPLFQASIRLRLYGKNMKDPKYSETMPVAKETTFIVKKHKVPIYAASGKFTVAMVPYKGLKPGQSDDFSTILDLMKDYGLAKKSDSGKGWQIYGAEYNTINEFKDEFLTKPTFANSVRQELITKLSKENGLLMEKDDEDKDEGDSE